MKTTSLAIAIALSFLFLLPAAVERPTTAAVARGLDGAYWLGSFFGSPAPTWPNCPTSSTPIPPAPAGSPSSIPPTVTETDPNINFGSTTGFYWDESSPTGVPGNPGGFAVTQGGYGVAAASWGDKNLYTDYPSSTYFVDTDFTVEWTGYITLTAGTTYWFQLSSDDGSALYINPSPGSSTISSGDVVINSWSTQPPTASTSAAFTPSGTTGTQGNYAIEVDYYETCDSQSGIDLSWSTTSSTSGFTIVPLDVFTPAALGSNAPPSITTPQFGFAVPVVAAFSLLAIALLRKRTIGQTNTTT